MRRAGAISWSRQAADCIAGLPDHEAETDRWQLAIENLIIAADYGAIAMLARIAVSRALNYDRPVTYRTQAKDLVWKRRWRERKASRK